jgi:hypothetical protein
MKRVTFFIAAFAMASMMTSTKANAQKTGLNYMLSSGVDQGFSFAKEKSKAVLVYFNSNECHSCEQFTGQVMSDDGVAQNITADYVSINANIKNIDARKWSKKFKAYDLPAVVLVSPEQDFFYTCSLKLDKEVLLAQIKNFFNVVSFRNQILLLQRTKSISFEEACDEMGASYGKIDFKRNPNVEPEDAYSMRTLNMKYFDKCLDAYIDAWDQQKNKGKTKSLSWKPAEKK